jgi:hypothetical protein
LAERFRFHDYFEKLYLLTAEAMNHILLALEIEMAYIGCSAVGTPIHHTITRVFSAVLRM